MSNGSSSPLQDLINMVEGVELSVNSFTEVANLRARLLAGLSALGVLTTATGVQVLSVTQPNQTLSNTTLLDQNFNSIFTIPANTITTNKIIRITIDFTQTTDAAASSQNFYVKLGTTKVFTYGAPIVPANNTTNSLLLIGYLFGRALPSAASQIVSDFVITIPGNASTVLNTTAPQNLATNTPLNIVPGLAFGTNTGGESSTLRSVLVESLN